MDATNPNDQAREQLPADENAPPETTPVEMGDVRGALLDFGGHMAVAVAFASFGVLVSSAPFFLLSGPAHLVVNAVCFVGSGWWAALSMKHFYRRVIVGREEQKVSVIGLSLVLLVIGVGAVFSVIEYNRAARIAAVCERVEHLAGNPARGNGTCQYYYTTRATSEGKILERGF